MINENDSKLLARIAEALEKIADKYNAQSVNDIDNFMFDANIAAYQWRAIYDDGQQLYAVKNMNHLPLNLLQNIDQQCQALMDNTVRFADGYCANNALLWGARGAGKSALVKSVIHEIRKNRDEGQPYLILIEINKEDIMYLQRLIDFLISFDHRFILFCDDLSFEEQDQSYKFLKTILEGSISTKPDNVILYATSNRRHILARNIIENEKHAAIHANEVIDEKISLSDRFGLWLGFHHHDQEAYLTMINAYITHFNMGIDKSEWRPKAIEWSVTRGSFSGRTAWQFILDLAGEKRIDIRE